MAVIVVVFLIAFAPAWYRGVRAKQLKGRVRKVSLARTQDEKRAAEDAAIADAGGKPRLLLDLAEAAVQLNQQQLADRAVALIEQQGALEADVKAFKKRTAAGPPPVRESAFEVAMAAKRMIADGRVDAAKERIEKGLERWPGDPELLAVKALL